MKRASCIVLLLASGCWKSHGLPGAAAIDSGTPGECFGAATTLTVRPGSCDRATIEATGLAGHVPTGAPLRVIRTTSTITPHITFRARVCPPDVTWQIFTLTSLHSECNNAAGFRAACAPDTEQDMRWVRVTQGESAELLVAGDGVVWDVEACPE
jgi:hypothetical protein